MERKRLLLFVSAMVVLCLGAPTFGQDQAREQATRPKLRLYFTVRKPAQGIDIDTIKGEMAKSTTLPLWTFDAHSSRDGNSYPGVMVGLDPFNNPGSVSVPTKVVPLIVKTHEVGVSVNPSTGAITTTPGLTILNPTVADNGCLTAPNNVPIKLFEQSPILQAAPFDFGGTMVGRTQYIDAFQRGNFWKALGSNVGKYHVLLSPEFLAPIVLDVPAIYGLSLAPDALTALGIPIGCGPSAIVDINWFDAYLTGTIIPALAAKGVNPTTLPFFFVYNVSWSFPVTDLFTCCLVGYHGITGVPTPTQTYAAANFASINQFSTSFHDTAIVSHEVGEWMNDPFGTNELTPWGHVGQQPGCQNNLEVGDPLTGTEAPRIVMPNGFTYHLQELTFFRWFFGAPSISVNGWYSNNGTFLTDAGPPCH